jgi:alginate O-acetyltransferase complex protein AlgI
VPFNSYSFIFNFLPLFCAAYSAMALAPPGRPRQQAVLVCIIATSLIFYAWPYPPYIWLLLLSISFNYGASLLLQADLKIPRKSVLVAGIVFNLALLGYYKYAGFFSAAANATLGTNWPTATKYLPLAISFITFQKIHFLVDVYRRQIQDRSFLRYAAFVTFFPQLISGPIVRYEETVPQFEQWRRTIWDPTNVAVGSTMFFVGMFKKAVIADSIAPIADQIFGAAAAGASISPSGSWLGVLAYTLQIYFDFSGYSDMAIGLARCLNIRFPANFDSPYQATDIAEFWRRWHMSLYRFLRDYVYIALGGNRKGVARTALNVLITMTLSGLWHGAAWTFVFWGLLHGLYLVAHQLWRRMIAPLVPRLAPSFLASLAGWIVTMVCVMIAWVFFRADSFKSALFLLNCMMRGEPNGLDVDALPAMALLGVAAFTALAPNTQQWMSRFDPVLAGLRSVAWPILRKIKWTPSQVWLSALVVVALIAVSFLGDTREQIYYRF